MSLFRVQPNFYAHTLHIYYNLKYGLEKLILKVTYFIQLQSEYLWITIWRTCTTVAVFFAITPVTNSLEFNQAFCKTRKLKQKLNGFSGIYCKRIEIGAQSIIQNLLVSVYYFIFRQTSYFGGNFEDSFCNNLSISRIANCTAMEQRILE